MTNNYLVVISILFIVYTYAVYPFILWVSGKLKKNSKFVDTVDVLPRVTVMFAAYNEESCIKKTLLSIVDSDYPKELLDVIVISDASTDNTDMLAGTISEERIRVLRTPERMGKKAALSYGYKCLTGEIIVFTDASSIFARDTISKLVYYFNNKKVGSISGSKRIINTGSSVSQGDGLYWRYDSLLRYLESEAGASWVGCEGGIAAIRRELFILDFPDDFAEDYSLCCNVFKNGYLNKYDPAAVIYETASKNHRMEFHRKIRVIVRGIRAFFGYGHLLNPIKYPNFFFQNISHRLFRWLVPFFLVILFIASSKSNNQLIRVLFYMQVNFYLAAILGFFMKYFKINSVKLLSIPLYFTIVNAAALFSWFLLFKKFKIWMPPKRG
ncbi:MAG: hypothetical protein A2219_01315 [Elusimicrobia bacterium RIFOXYA2_FULL_50_26]|nr:MAG: hypothetical protein A2219_01315 [Elusimicrobia bacterium RIFOXYA2_FULL_50_26]OGS24295.1 MAG: hypothetical protein A2314_07555 [Elusimicrobia bacterium RIFOXYB2_FULL_50_12]